MPLGGRGRDKLTSSSDAVGAVAVAALRAGPDDRAVDVLGLVGVDVAGAAAAVGDFGSGHVCEGGRLIRGEIGSWGRTSWVVWKLLLEEKENRPAPGGSACGRGLGRHMYLSRKTAAESWGGTR
jgi:hypothetical protein